MSRISFKTLVITLTIGMTLALPAGLFVLLKNMQCISQNLPIVRSPIVLYLKLPTTETTISALSSQIRSRREVENIIYISPKEGLAELQQQFGLGNIVDLLQGNPLPALLIVMPKLAYQTASALENLVTSFKNLPQVDTVKLDLNWSQRLQALLKLMQKLLHNLFFMMCVASLFIVGSLIFFAVKCHLQESGVYRSFGIGSNRSRSSSSLYQGFLYGLLGGMFAWIMVSLALFFLGESVEALIKLYGSSFVLQRLTVENGVVLLLLSGVTGSLTGSLSKL